ncbi:MAG: hypothetical protein GX335_05045 [Firmicutes bacterium]|nr:hypothetical protein [Bacillota bacterium]
MCKRWKTVFVLTLTTFVLSILLNLSSNSLLAFLPLAPSLVLLLFIILIGVLFDVIGVAATASDESPLHAMASNRIVGAKQAIWLVRHADGVSTFCNDLVGDVAGTLSGAIGVSLIFQLSPPSLGLEETLTTTFIVALVAAFTVGGKSLGKSFAISNSTSVLIAVGRVLRSLEALGLTLDSTAVKNKKR